MNREQWKEMTIEEQHLKVASLCGWVNLNKRAIPGYGFISGMEDNEHLRWHGTHPSIDGGECCIPNCLYDLNVIHESFMSIIVPQGRDVVKEYLVNLCNVIGKSSLAIMAPSLTQSDPSGVFYNDMAFMVLGASTAERVEAFVLTLDKV